MTSRAAWADAHTIDRQAANLASSGDTAALMRLILAVPLPDAVRLAKRYSRTGWPAWRGQVDTPDPTDSQLLARLAESDENVISRVAAAAARESCQVHKDIPVARGRLSFGFTGPVFTVTWHTSELSRISMYRNGTWIDVYRGTFAHDAVACIDADNVVAVRHHPERRLVLMHYAGGEERPVMFGDVLGGMRLAATAAGFVAGSAFQAAALVAGPDLPPGIMNLRPFGLPNAYRLATNPSGVLIAFGGDEQIVITDAPVQNLVARSVGPLPHGPTHQLVFTTADQLVVGGTEGGLSRWTIGPDEELAISQVSEAPRLDDVFAIRAWNVVGGHEQGHGYRFFDPITLAAVEPPRLFAEATHSLEYTHAIVGSTNGRYAAVSGQLAVDRPNRHDRSFDLMFVVHDFGHPLARVLQPVAALNASDAQAISTMLAQPDQLSSDERYVLDQLAVLLDRALQAGDHPQ